MAHKIINPQMYFYKSYDYKLIGLVTISLYQVNLY